jgi:hypothetical protein
MTLRPAVVPPNRGFLIGAWIGGSALLVSIAAAVVMRMPDAPPAPVAKVTVSPAAPIVVPVPITITPPPPPPPVVIAEPEPAPIRAATPFLQAACVLADGDTPSCTWDRGFPAISSDGRTMVREAVADDGGRGHPNLSIEFVDVATSKVERSVLILDAEEYDPENHDKLAATIQKRVAAAQKLLAAGAYRSLLPLAHIDDATSGGTLRIEPSGGAVRIIDTRTRLAIFQASFEASVVAPEHKYDVENDCSGLHAREPAVWFDEHTRTALVTVNYTYGGCMCGSETRVFVRRIP